MTANTTPIPEPDQIRAIARAYALECQQSDIKPTLRGICSRFNRHNCWLTASPLTPNATLVRSIILMEWLRMDVPLTAAQIDIDIDPPRQKNAQSQAQPVPQVEPVTEWAMPTEYISGRVLFDFLLDEDRLRQFCHLVDSAGPKGAFEYVQISRNFAQARAKAFEVA
jgi:hypothetical protein